MTGMKMQLIDLFEDGEQNCHQKVFNWGLYVCAVRGGLTFWKW